MYMCIVHARIPLIPRLLEKVNFILKCNQNQYDNLLASIMQWSPIAVTFSIHICSHCSVCQQEFHHFKVATPEVT